MKLPGAILLVVLAGCSASPSLQELEDEAAITGDWTAVEERERLIRLRLKRKGIECPDGTTTVCREVGMTSKCQCFGSVVGGYVGTR